MLLWLERRFGRFAIPNVTLLIIVAQVAVYVGSMQNAQVFAKLTFDAAQIRAGEYHRLISFLAMPPGANPFFAFFFWYLFYMMGTALELFWGTFRYNIFLLIGYLATVTTAMLVPGGTATNWFLEGTVFLAFAFLNPDFQMYLFFILPIRIKWLAMLTWVLFGLMFINGSWPERVQVAASVINFLIFFGRDIRDQVWRGRRHMARQAKRFTEKKPEYFHRCAVCGITDKSHPHMDFRYCSKCEGDACYCTEHLRDHEHNSPGA